MNDISWDAVNRNIIILNNDFATTNQASCSTQNGTIILEANAFNIIQPTFGVGYNQEVLGGDEANAAFELNRAVSQINTDGGTAKWTRIANPPNVQFDFSLSVNYPQ